MRDEVLGSVCELKQGVLRLLGEEVMRGPYLYGSEYIDIEGHTAVMMLREVIEKARDRRLRRQDRCVWRFHAVGHPCGFIGGFRLV